MGQGWHLPLLSMGKQRRTCGQPKWHCAAWGTVQPLDQRCSYLKEHGLCQPGALPALCMSLLATQEPLDLARVHDTTQEAHPDLAMIRWSSAWCSAIEGRIKNGMEAIVFESRGWVGTARHWCENMRVKYLSQKDMPHAPTSPIMSLDSIRLPLPVDSKYHK